MTGEGDVGQRVREWRERRAYDRAELARAVGIAPSTLWRIERGKVRPRGVTVRKLAAALGVEPAVLLGKD